MGLLTALDSLNKHRDFLEREDGRFVRTAYLCGECFTRHSDKDEAKDCCPPRTIAIWVCPVCEDSHETYTDALKCCPDVPHAHNITRPSPAQLEACGQLRIV